MLLSSTDIRNMAYNLSTRWNLPKNVTNLNKKLNSDPFIEKEAPLLSYQDPVNPDNWQTVVLAQIFVYMAHLDLWNFMQSIIHVLGTMGHVEVIKQDDLSIVFYGVLCVYIFICICPQSHHTVSGPVIFLEFCFMDILWNISDTDTK